MRHVRTLSRRERIEMKEMFNEHRDHWCRRLYATDIDDMGGGVESWLEYRGGGRGLDPTAHIDFKSIGHWHIDSSITSQFISAHKQGIGMYVAQYTIHPHDEWLWTISKIGLAEGVLSDIAPNKIEPEHLDVLWETMWITDEQMQGWLHGVHQLTCCVTLPRMKGRT